MKTQRLPGFTVVELIIVIIVIAILAAIVVVGYNGATRAAAEASMRSDLQNATGDLELARQHNNAYPTDASTLNDGKGISASKDNTITYESKPYGYCISVTNPRTGAVYHVKSLDVENIEDISCTVDANQNWSGSATNGNADGPVGTAQLGATAWGEVGQTAVDSQGVIYLADKMNNRIRKIDLNGTVMTFAGDGSNGYVAGVGTAAKICAPSDIATDSNDNIYVTGGCAGGKLFKVTPDAVVTIIPNITDNVAGVDSAENIWTTKGSCAKKFSQDGTLILTVGDCNLSGYQDGSAATALFGYNGSVGIGGTVDKLGNLFVADRFNNKVRKVTPDGTVSTFFGQGTITSAGSGGIPIDGPASTIGLYRIRDILVDTTGAVWLTTKDNFMFLRRIEPDGSVIKTASLGTDGVKNGNQAGYLNIPEPGHMSIDNKRGLIYVTGTSTYINRVSL